MADYYDYYGDSVETTVASTVAPSNLTIGNMTTISPTYMPGLPLHPFWIKYGSVIEGVPDYFHYIIGVLIAVAGIWGFLGNMMVMYIFASTRALRTPPNMFVINLALSDAAFSAVNGFPLLTVSSFMKKWYFGKLACELYAFFGGVTGLNSINTLMLISMDRHFVITNPFEAMRKVTKKRAAIQLALVWAWSLLWSIPPLVGWGSYIPEGFQTSCSFDYLTRTWLNITYVWCLFGFGFLLPVFVIIICYYQIVSAVARQAKEMGKKSEKPGDAKKKKKELGLAKIAAGTVSLFVISWFPYAFVAMSGINGFDQFVNPYTSMIPVLFAKASACWNPILYALTHPKFRAQLEERFPSLLCCEGKNIDKDEEESGVSKMDRKKGKAQRSPSVKTVDSVEMTDTTDNGNEVSQHI